MLHNRCGRSPSAWRESVGAGPRDREAWYGGISLAVTALSFVSVHEVSLKLGLVELVKLCADERRV